MPAMPASQRQPNSSRGPKYRILTSFAAIMVLTLTVAAIGLNRLADNNRSMEAVVDQYYAKTGYIVTMHHAARERTISLLRMTSLDDPFQRDEEYMRFHALGAKFAEARAAFHDKGLSPEETELYDAQGRSAANVVALFTEVAQLLVEGEVPQATGILLNQAMPAQDELLEKLVQMLEHQHVAAQQAMAGSKRSYRRASIFISLLSAVTIGIGVLMSLFVMRRASQTESVLISQFNQERELREQLSYQARHDSLTGLINRFEFDNQLQRILESASREQVTHALLYLDLDQFKVVNDTCGHVAGDELLRQLAAILKRHIRSHDTLARLGGDEFGVLLEYCAPEYTVKVAGTLLDAVQEFRFAWDDKSFVVGASIGVVIIDQHSQSMADVLSAADAACYSAKEAGRNRVHVVRDNDSTIAQRYGEMQWVARINEALEQNRFVLFCQLIAPAGGRGSTTPPLLEILVRMVDRAGNLIPPGAFIPAAERYNLMMALDRHVVRATFAYLGANPAFMQDLGLCSINLSGQSISESRFLDFLLHLFETSRVPAAKICFEITETAAITNLNAATRFINELKRIGCSFALDDFGSGLSSFAYLKNLPVDILKIDGGFVRDIADDPIDQAMVRSINEIGHVMGKRTIAEFVETEAVLDILRDIGVDYVQGYRVGRPLPLEAYAAARQPQRRHASVASSN